MLFRSVEAKSVGSDKEYSLNIKMVRDLFDHMYHNFGPGFKPVPRPAASEAEKE